MTLHQRFSQAVFPQPGLEASVSLHGRVFTEAKKETFVGSVKKAGRTFREYADVSDPTHPWHKILKAAEKYSQGTKSAGKSVTPFIGKSGQQRGRQGPQKGSGRGVGSKKPTEGGSSAHKAFEKVRRSTERARSYRLGREQGRRGPRGPHGRSVFPRR